MNDANTQNDRKDDPSAAFIRMWTESCSRVMQAALSSPPDAIPPEILRQIRTGLLQSMAQSWDAYLRSPQFMEGMQQMMEGAVAFRKMTADMFTKGRQETQGVSREDIDGLRSEIRQSEDRILAMVEDLVKKFAEASRPTSDARPAPSSREPQKRPAVKTRRSKVRARTARAGKRSRKT